MKKIIMITPLIALITICSFVLIYILSERNPQKPPSSLINKNIPSFNIYNLYDENKTIKNSDLKNKYTLINFFASWCAPCKVEHHLFFKIKEDNPDLFILGINYKDNEIDAKDYLINEGNPYSFVGIDANGKIGLDFGVFGLPETFLINNKGEIIFKHIGPITEQIIYEQINPLL
ncbi:MAG: Thiol:disulfide interchange protein DsbE [Alphaproteobacteria bacterium MarineAlpha5_Bin5]|nr:MAG: Thiol:disulfide interchange protein DsbE [Alphaproteobacteria bacterium MarineAlpha5_Bin4]PPR50166.1 MAG: Thiol:disulfide interchange protein DsbE [Alphaproteobacteria bacterium MarineAlpha5_Bin5]|tara:strand:+ start:2561 stop:3085 length:525 start_codon:yes stop_codon:yes gene_type:complete